MRRITTAVFLVLLATTSFALPPGNQDRERFHHFILTPARLLNEQEQADLRSRGLVIERALTNGRFLVRIAEDAAVGSDDPRIARLEPLTADRKLNPSAIREVASGKPVAHLNVLFNDEVTFADAKKAIEQAGGSLVEPLQTDFHVLRRIPAVIASTSVKKLAGDERVMLVYGPTHLIPVTDNADEAAMSNVTPLYTSPYNLSGQGVVLSYFELAQADATHPEFQGRLITHVTGGASADKDHATHTGGTMIAAGLDPKAKGMAPAATLHELDANNAFPDAAAKNSEVAINNSWGYILGWCKGTGKCSDWTWGGNELYYGGYDSLITAPIDKLTRSANVLFVHSAGNDAGKIGPTTTPFAHSHFDNNDNVVSGYCYSTDGSGNDCPAPTCKTGLDTSGDPFCEKTKHPQLTELLPPPWISIGLTASAKNVIAVGAVDFSKTITGFSSRGPTRDGRVKPDLVTKGLTVYSTVPGSSYANMNGTSMAAPVVTGTSALIVEQWRRTFGNQNPAPAVIKTLMIATADDLGNPGPDYTYGFGLLDAKAAIDTIVADGGQGRRIVQNSVATGDEIKIPMSVSAAGDLKVVIGWSDPEVLTFPVDSGDPTDPLAAQTLVNDLDLKVIDPTGNTVLPYVLDRDNPGNLATHGVNKVDNTEEVEIPNAVAGTYQVIVNGTSITAASPQAFVLVANADLGNASKPCTEPFGPTTTPETAYGNLVSTQTISSRTCDPADVDYFKFLVDKAGPVSVKVTATDTPLRVTLTSSATATATMDVPAGATQLLSANYTGSAPVEFFVRVEPTGTIGVNAAYSVTPTFSSANQLRRRSVRRH